jgi:Family of unknown function (DUF695)
VAKLTNQMKKILLTTLVSVLIATKLFSFQNSNEKGVEQERFPEENFSNSQTTDENGGLVIVTANGAYKNYKFKADYPWFLLVQIKTIEKNKNGQPTNTEAESLNQVKDLISTELKKVCVPHYIGHTTSNGLRELFYYVDDPEKAYTTLQELKNNPDPLRQFEYQIVDDGNWYNASITLKVN